MTIVHLDLETTGLNPTRCQILEIAAIATDLNGDELSRFSTLVKPVCNIQEVDPVVIEMHAANGLWREALARGVTIQEADKALAAWFLSLPASGKLELVGRSIHFDQGFLKVHCPAASSCLSHRLRDVSMLERQLEEWGVYEAPIGERPSHRAMDDVEQQLAAWKRVKEHLQAPKPPAYQTPAEHIHAALLGLECTVGWEDGRGWTRASQEAPSTSLVIDLLVALDDLAPDGKLA